METGTLKALDFSLVHVAAVTVSKPHVKLFCFPTINLTHDIIGQTDLEL
jgi:hypothetical protein